VPLKLSALALALAGLGGCSDDDHRDKFFGMDVGTTFDTSTPPETAPAAEVGDTAGGEARDGDAGDGGTGDAAGDGSVSDAADAADANQAAEVAPDTTGADASDAATD
jgi:hypothetical protein